MFDPEPQHHEMTLKEALIAYGKAHLTETNDWYNWNVEQKNLPTCIDLPPGNQFIQNVTLKMELSRLYSVADNQKKMKITRYYIADWGGIRSNRPEKIQSYSLDTSTSLIAKGSHGIASWSKALCIRNPNRYAIYDARVAVSLNCLQIAQAVDRPSKFPLLSGQNKSINKGSEKLHEYATIHNWPTVGERIFYQKYNGLLFFAARLLGVKTATLEMLLFAKAVELLHTTFPKEDF